MEEEAEDSEEQIAKIEKDSNQNNSFGSLGLKKAST